MRIRFDSGPSGVGSDFCVPTEIISAQTTTELSPALARLDKARRDGFWLAGYTSYELGYLLEPRLLPRLPTQRRLPLLRFGVYGPPRQTALATGTAQLSQFTPLWDRAAYETAFAVVHSFIAAGDIYQANLTFPLQATTDSCSQSLYAALAAVQPVQYGALILQDGLPDILSRAPELFFRTDAQGNIQTRPRKGTQPRHNDPVKDRARRDFLANDPKNRAENLMIVDLLRNDMARVCQPGSVKVPGLFKVET